MKVTGIITNIYPEISGVSQNGKEWRRQKFVVNYDNSKPEFPKSIAFEVKGDNIDKFNLRKGGSYTLDLDFSTTENQGRIYTDITCWKVCSCA